MNTIILSDLHLGARNSRTDLLAEVLDTDFDRLILNGDIVDSPDPRLFLPCHRRILDRLRYLSRKREVIVLRGNHDALPGPANPRGTTCFLANLLGTDILDEYELEINGDRYLVLHGDRFDRTMNLTWVGDVADWCYRRIQRMSKPLAHWVKGMSKHLCGVVGSVQNGALSYAQERGFNGVITAHTHFWHDEVIADIHYLNTGCWVDWPCSYIHLNGGLPQVHHWGDAFRLNWRKPRGSWLRRKLPLLFRGEPPA